MIPSVHATETSTTKTTAKISSIWPRKKGLATAVILFFFFRQMDHLTPIDPEVKRAQMAAGRTYLRLVQFINDPSRSIPDSFPLPGPLSPSELEHINTMLKGKYKVQVVTMEKMDENLVLNQYYALRVMFGDRV